MSAEKMIQFIRACGRELCEAFYAGGANYARLFLEIEKPMC